MGIKKLTAHAISNLAGVAGLEPTALGFGDQCSTN